MKNLLFLVSTLILIFTSNYSFGQSQPRLQGVWLNGNEVDANSTYTIEMSNLEHIRFKVQFDNTGDDSPAYANGIDISFPQYNSSSDKNLVYEGNSSSDMTYGEYIGYEIYEGYAPCLLIEGQDNDGWDGKDSFVDVSFEDNHLEVFAKPKQYGLFRIYFRSYMDDEVGVPDPTFNPTSGPSDCVGDNAYYIDINVIKPACPDLMIDGLLSQPYGPVVGESVDLHVDVTNVGDGIQSERVYIKYYINGIYIDDDYFDNDLSRDQYIDTEYESNYSFTSAGTYTYRVEIETNGEECSTSNNWAETTIIVKETPTPDLVIKNQTLSSTILNPKSNFTASCYIHNLGDGNANSSTIGYYLSQNTTFENTYDTPLGSNSISSLIAGSNNSVNKNLIIPDWAEGDFYILFVADLDNEVDEQNSSQSYENNNVEHVAISVEPIYGNASIYVSQNTDLKENAEVIVYLPDNSVKKQLTDSSGNTIFYLPTDDNYYFDVFNYEFIDEGRELWASSQIIFDQQNNTFIETVDRSYPYVGSIHGRNGSTIYELPTDELPLGSTIDLQLAVLNNYSSTYNSRVTLMLDENMDNQMDFTSNIFEQPIDSGSELVKIPVTIRESWAGKELFVKIKVESFINNAWQQTDLIEFNEYNWSLKIGTVVDNTPPSLITDNINPQNNDIIDPDFINQVGIFLEFSEPIDESTLNNTTFILTDQNNNPIPGTFDFTLGASGQYYFHPSINLDYDSDYQYSLTTGIKDLRGNSTSIQYIISFRTALEGKVLQVPYYFQGTTSWCGFASISMLLEYYGYEKKFWEIAAESDFENKRNVDVSGKNLYNYLNNKYSDNIDAVWGIIESGNEEDLINQIKSSINNNNPLVIGIDGENHAVVITGYDDEGVFLHDPSGIVTKSYESLNGEYHIYHSLSWSDFKELINTPFWAKNFLIFANNHKINPDPKSFSIQFYDDFDFDSSDPHHIPIYSISAINRSISPDFITKITFDGSENKDLGYLYENEASSFSTNSFGITKKFTSNDTLKINPIITNYSYPRRSGSLQFRIKINEIIQSNLFSEQFAINDIGSIIPKRNSEIGEYKYYVNKIPDIILSEYNEGNYNLTVELLNSKNEIEDEFSLYFEIASISNDPPKVVDHYPRNKATDISSNPQITVRFNMDMDKSTIENPSNWRLFGKNEWIEPESIQYDVSNRIARFYPKKNLDEWHSYLVTLTTGIKSASGIQLAENFSFSFSTLEFDVLEISAIDSNPINGREPLLLIHGWQPSPKPAPPGGTIWSNFIKYVNSEEDQDDEGIDTIEELKRKFKLYKVNYYSNLISVDEIGYFLRKALDEKIDPNNNEKIDEFNEITIIAHSMGGLVSRSFMNLSISDGPLANIKGGERVTKLITLGTPHHGSPMSNGEIRHREVPLSNISILDDFDRLLYGILSLSGGPRFDEFNRKDLWWDNYDGLWNLLGHTEDNLWLKGLNLTESYSNKIAPFYGTYSTNGTNTDTDTEVAYFSGNLYMKIAFGIESKNDGIVPVGSGSFEGKNTLEKRRFTGYNHDQIVKGKEPEETNYSDPLFESIANELLDVDGGYLISEPIDKFNFDNVVVNESNEKVFLLENNGNANINVSNLFISGNHESEFSIVNPRSFSLPKGSVEEITIRFQPTSEGDKIAYLNITHDALNKKSGIIQLNGQGVINPIKLISIEPKDQLFYESVRVDGTDTKAIEISSTGTGDLTVSEIEITGTDAVAFSIILPENNSLLLPKGSIEQIYVQFHPTSEGTKSAKLVITNDSENLPNLEIELFGNAISGDILLASEPNNELEFDETLLNDPQEKTITINNPGTTELEISKLEITGISADQFDILNNAQPTILGGDSFEIQIQFNPTEAGLKTANLEIANNSDNESPIKTIQLSGLAVDNSPPDEDNDQVPDSIDQCPNTPEGTAVDDFGCPIGGSDTFMVLEPNDGIDFGNVDVDSSLDKILTINNTGSEALNISKIEIVGTDSSLFNLINYTNPQVISSGEFIEVTIRMNTPSEGNKNAQLEITNDSDNASPVKTIQLSGLGVDNSLQDEDNDLVPDSIDQCPNTPEGTEVDEFGCPVVQSDFTAIPDSNFEQALIDLGYDSDGVINGQVLTADISERTTLNIPNRNISNLIGIEDFTALMELRCGNNIIEELDVTNNHELTYIDSNSNLLKAIDLSLNKKLLALNLNGNKMQSLNVSSNMELTNLRCENNQLIDLDLHQNSSLIQVYCRINKLKTLNLKNGSNELMQYMDASYNFLSCIQVDNEINANNGIGAYAYWTKDITINYSEDCPTINYDKHLLATGISNYYSQQFRGIVHEAGFEIHDEEIAKINTSTLADKKVLVIINGGSFDGPINWDGNQYFSTSQVNDILDFISKGGRLYISSRKGYDSLLSQLGLSISGNDGGESGADWPLVDLAATQFNPHQITENLVSIQGDVGANFAVDSNWNIIGKENDGTNLLAVRDFGLGEVVIWYGQRSFRDDYDFAYGVSNNTSIDVYDNFQFYTNLFNHFSNPSSPKATSIPDSNFEQALIDQNIDSDGVTNGQVFTSDISSIQSLDVSEKNLNDLTGIEDFENLLNLSCWGNQLTTVDLSHNVKLTNLDIYENQLTSLDVTNNSSLLQLNCSQNQITELNVTSNINLIYLNCNNNQISSIDVTQNKNLDRLTIYNNLITSLNVNENKSLTSLECQLNQLTTLGLSQNTALIGLSCNSNKLTNLNLSKNIVLRNLQCQNNQLLNIDLTNNVELVWLSIYNNELSSLNVELNKQLTYINAVGNPNLTCIQVDNETDANSGTGVYTNWLKDVTATYSEDCTESGIVLSAKVYLQGPSSLPETLGLMNSLLLRANNLITTSPYADALSVDPNVFNQGGVSASGLQEDDIVDWIWLELQDPNTKNMVTGRSGLLQRDGDIVDLDGMSDLYIKAPIGDYYLLVNHRNHLAITSSEPLSLSNAGSVIDFSSNYESVMGGSNALVDIGNGKLAIYSGDFDGNGQVQNTDLNGLIPDLGLSGYQNSDLDLNGEVQNTDISNLLNVNLGRGQQFESSNFNGIANKKNQVKQNVNRTDSRLVNYSFANAQNTFVNGKEYYEVDVVIETMEDFKLGSGQLYLNYNVEAFGTNISSNKKLIFESSADYILGELVDDFPAYNNFVQQDNTTSKLSVSYQQSPVIGSVSKNNVTLTPRRLFHLKFEYKDSSKEPMVSFETDGLYLDQTYTACGSGNEGGINCLTDPGKQLINDTFDNTLLTLGDESLDNAINIYPNPFSTQLTVKSKVVLSKIEMFSVLGEKVKHIENNFESIPLGKISNGFYLLKIYTEQGYILKKVIKH